MINGADHYQHLYFSNVSPLSGPFHARHGKGEVREGYNVIFPNFNSYSQTGSHRHEAQVCTRRKHTETLRKTFWQNDLDCST